MRYCLKKLKSLSLASFLIASATVPQPAAAMPVGVTQTKNMCDRAELIFAGKTEKLIMAPGPAPTPGGSRNATVIVRVIRTIKNTTGSPIAETVKITSRQASDHSLTTNEGERGIFFVRREGKPKDSKSAKDTKELVLVPVDEQHIGVPFSPTSDCPLPAGKTPLEIVTTELVKVIDTPAAKLNTVKLPPGQAFGTYRDMYNEQGTFDQATVVYGNAADALRSLPTKDAVPLLVKVTQSKDIRCQLRAVHALALLKNFDSVPVIEKILMDPPKAYAFDVAQIANHLMVEDKKYEPLMRRLSKSKSPWVRKAARDNLENLKKL